MSYSTKTDSILPFFLLIPKWILNVLNGSYKGELGL